MSTESCICHNVDVPRKPTVKDRIKRLVGYTKTWVYLNVWCRYFYRVAMRTLHRYNLHYAPPSPMSPQFGEQHHWCQWCGLRGTTYKYDPENTLKKLP